MLKGICITETPAHLLYTDIINFGFFLDQTYQKPSSLLYDEVSASLSSCDLCDWGFIIFNRCICVTPWWKSVLEFG